MGKVIKLEVVHKSGSNRVPVEVTEFQGRRSRQKPSAMEQLAWDRLTEALQMQSRCFCWVCVSVLYR